MKTYLEIGRITSPHGVRGEVKLEVWGDSPEALKDVKEVSFHKEGSDLVKVESSRPHQGRLLMKLSGVNTMDEANALRGKVLYAHREAIRRPEGSYFIDDLMGLRVVDADTGQDYGTLTDVAGLSGRNDVYTVTDGEGKERLFPAIPQVVIRTDLENGVMVIRPLEGLFDED